MYLLDDETYEKLIRLQNIINYTDTSDSIKNRINNIIPKIGYMEDKNFYIRASRRKAKIKRGI